MRKSILVAAAVALQFAVCSIAVAQTRPASPLISAQQRSAVHATLQTARTNAVAAGATRRQVQDIRAAVKARLPVVRR